MQERSTNIGSENNSCESTPRPVFNQSIRLPFLCPPMFQSYTTKLPSVARKVGNCKDRRAACLLLNSSSSSCPHLTMDVSLLNQNGPSALSIKASIKWRGPLMAEQARTQYSTLHLPYWLWFLVEMWKLFFFGLHWQMTVCFHHLVSQQLCLIHTHLSQPINRSRFLVGLSIESSNHKFGLFYWRKWFWLWFELFPVV